MMKVLVIIGIIFGFIILGLTIVIKTAKRFLGIGNIPNINRNNSKYQDNDILYQKEDVIVLKGDAKK